MKKKILIIEKDEDTLQIISHLLMEEGYQVSTSSSEFGIFELIRKEMPDIILLDILKPTVQGAALNRAIKATEGINRIPILSYSMYLKYHGAESDGLEEEQNTQPFNLLELLNIIERQQKVR